MIANAGVNGTTGLAAGHDLNLKTVDIASSHDVVRNADNYSKQSTASEVGSQINGAGDVSLRAVNDIALRAASIDAKETLALSAGNDITLATGVEQKRTEEASKVKKKRTFSSKTTTKLDIVDTSNAIGNSLGADAIAMSAGHDLSIIGSNVLADKAVSLAAGNDLTIAAAVNTSKELHRTEVKQSGFLSGGGFGISYGTRTTAVDQERDAQTQSGLARSSVGALGGDLSLSANNALKIGGSDLMASADLNLTGKSVLIDPGQDDVKGKYEMRMTQDGFTASLGGSVISAIQTMQSMSTAASQAKDGRVTAMAAATAAIAAKNAYKDVAGKDASPSINISLTYGHSESKQVQTTENLTHSGSVLTGNNINIAAIGAGKASNIDIIGSELNAANTVRLQADNNINLLAAQDTESQHSTSSSMSASAGVAATVSTSGTSFGITASVSASKGHEDGSGTTQLNTHIKAGDKLEITSGGDTTIKGAVANANQVIAAVNGNLNLESLQDLAKFDSKSQSISVSGTVGFGASVSGSYSQSKIHNDYASVQEQSGIRAGDGGFQLKVGGNTDLKGAVISSTEAGKSDSSLSTATLTASDIANHAISKGSSVGVSGGFSVAGTGTQDKSQTNVGGKGGATGGTPAIAAVSDNDSSTTRSGISGGTVVINDDAAQSALAGKGAQDSIAGLNRNVTTGVDSSGKIANNLDKAAMQATMEVTKAYAAAAAKEVGDFAESRLKESRDLAAQALEEPDPVKKAALEEKSKELEETWSDGSATKLALHSAIGGLAGGAGGALGAGASALTAKQISEEIDKLDVPDEVKNILTTAASASLGALVGGAEGATGAANETANNLLLHKDRKKKLGLDKYDSVMLSPEELANSKNDSDVFKQYAAARGCGYYDASCYQQFQAFVKSVPAGEYALVLSEADDVATRRKVILAYMGDEAESKYKNDKNYRSTVDSISEKGGAYYLGSMSDMLSSAVDHMGQPLYSSSKYDSFGKLKEIVTNNNSGVIDKAKDVLGWATYTVPDATKKNASQENTFASTLANMANNPFSGVVGGILAYNGASQTDLYYATSVTASVTDALGAFGGFGQSKSIRPVTNSKDFKYSLLLENNFTTGNKQESNSILKIGMDNQPGRVVRNAMSDYEFSQAQEIVSFKGGVFDGAPTSKFPGIDGWLDGVPAQLKIVEGKSILAVQRNIVGGAKDMKKEGYVGDLYVDITKTDVGMDQLIRFAKPESPISNILNEGTVNNVYVKSKSGWLNITKGTITVPTKE
ncbi:hypothetical protein ASF61_22370 [Duganella sp. Leaf126]|uniref:hemagglutinin repeat-containing protein n=1 Tax=Duganella sp. Leaf126 TaxID=1736266 RepID=UPI0007019505|nr:hemagglutinin repeat-containing protein [Duganella sp. Leaf126]KQQ37542.1 hypothetical protein ASF61_22370 [Duganella sp. Leaf126]